MKKSKLTEWEAEKILAVKFPEARCRMSKKREMEFVAELYELYERIGFLDTYNDWEELGGNHKGLPFQVIGRIPPYNGKNDGCDPRFLPMWRVRFENGDELDAAPSNISKANLSRSADNRRPDRNDEREQRWLSRKLAKLLADNPGIGITPIVVKTKKQDLLYGVGSYRLSEVKLGEYFRPLKEDCVSQKLDSADQTQEAKTERRRVLLGSLAYFHALDDIDKMSEKEIYRKYEELPWKKTIFVEIDTYDEITKGY